MNQTTSKLGIIGVGHLGSAIVRGLLRSQTIKADEIMLYDPMGSQWPELPQASSVEQLCEVCDPVILCVKPKDAQAVLTEMAGTAATIISTVAGLPAERVKQKTGAHVLRVMPNLPVSLDVGAIAYAEPNDLSPEQFSRAKRLLSALGLLVGVPETDFDIVTGLSGSGPAYVYLFIQAMVAGGVSGGLTSQTALMLAAQTLRGAADIAEQAGPGNIDQLIAGVTTPGGTTAAGMQILDENKVFDNIRNAVLKASERASELARE